jgi:hypothetical protein
VVKSHSTGETVEAPDARRPMNLDEVAYRAAVDGNIETVKIALANGADVNARYVPAGHTGPDTMLCIASEEGHCDLVKFLLERGADPNLSDNDTYDIKPLVLAKNERAIDLLVASGAAVDYARRPTGEDEDAGETALMRHASLGRIDCVRALLRNGACFYLWDHRGQTALDMARESSLRYSPFIKYREIIDLLEAVEAAGSWKVYVREPVVALLKLRYLCLAGRATPPPHLARCFGSPPIANADKARTRSRRLASSAARTPLPDEVFEHILTFWNFA